MTEPVTLAEAKLHLRANSGAHPGDAMIATLIAISESAHQAMIFEGRSCGGTRSISL